MILFISAIGLRAEVVELDNSFAPKLYGYGQVPEMVWNPVSNWLYCRVVADRMNGQDLTTNLIRFSASGVWDDTWALDHNGEITCIAIQPDGKLLIGGNFTMVNGHATLSVARVNADGSVDTSFTCNISSSNGTVSALAVKSTSSVYVGLTDESTGSIYCLSSTGATTSVQAFTANVRAIATMADGRILVGGGDEILRYSSSLIRDYSFDVSVDLNIVNSSPFDTVPPVQVNEIIVANESGQEYIWVAGRFSSINGQEMHGLAHLDSNGVLANDMQQFFEPIPSGPSSTDYVNILDIDVSNYQLAYAGIQCRLYHDQVDRIYGDELGYIDLSPNWPHYYNKYKQSGPKNVGTVEIAGFSFVYGSKEVNSAAESQPALTFESSGAGDEIELYRPRVPSKILPRSNGGVFLIGAQIREVNGQPMPGIVALDAYLNVDTTFQPDFESLYVSLLLNLPDGRTLIFGSIDGVRQMVLLDQNGQRIEGFNFSYSSTYFSTYQDYIWQMPSGKVLVAGLSNLGGASVPNLLLFDLTNLDEKLALVNTSGLLVSGIIDPDFLPNLSATTYDAVGLDDGRIIVTGSFSDGRILLLNKDGTIDESFRPQDQFGIFPSNTLIERDMFGRIYLCPTTANKFFLLDGKALKIVRLLQNGEIDSNYQNGSKSYYTRKFFALESGQLLVSGGAYIPAYDWGVILVDEDGNLDDSYFVDDTLIGFDFQYTSGAVYSAYIDRKLTSWGRAPLINPPASEAFITPSITHVPEGEDVTFWLADRGADETYQWMLGGAMLDGETGPSLTIDPTTLADAGEVSAQAIGPGGMVLRTAKLQVNGFDFSQWGAAQGLTPEELADPNSDLNGDGLSLGAEFLLRTDLGGPTTRSWAQAAWDGSTFQLNWEMLPGRRYWVDCSPNLVDWTPVGSYTSDAAEAFTLNLALDPEAPCFYQVRIELITD